MDRFKVGCLILFWHSQSSHDPSYISNDLFVRHQVGAVHPNTILISAWQFLSVVRGPQDWIVSNFTPLLAHSSISKFHLGHDKLFKLYYFLFPLCHFLPSCKTSFSCKEDDYFVVTDCVLHRSPFLCFFFYCSVKWLFLRFCFWLSV